MKKRKQSSGRKERREKEKKEAVINTPRNQRWIRTAEWALKKDIEYLFRFIQDGTRTVDDYPIGPDDDIFSELGTIHFSQTDLHAIKASCLSLTNQRVDELNRIKDPALGGFVKPNNKQMSNEKVTTKAAAEEFFLKNSEGSIICVNGNGEEKECGSFTEAEAHFEQFTGGEVNNTDAVENNEGSEEKAGSGEEIPAAQGGEGE